MPCQVCAERDKNKVVIREDGERRRRCDTCGEPIPAYPQMGGNGFQAHRVDHHHEILIDGKKAAKPIFRELCHECYLKDHAEAYPGLPLPEIVNVRPR